MKTIPVSVRLSQDSVEFLANLKIKGATTPSEKLRAIIEDAQLNRDKEVDFSGCFQLLQEQLAPVVENVKKAELDLNIHSEAISRSIEWLPDFMAYVTSSFNGIEEISKDDLIEVEKNIADRVFRLIESYLQMGVTNRCPCYTPELIRNNIGPILELTELINSKS